LGIRELESEDLLRYVVSQGMINLDDVRKTMQERERQRILRKHPYEIRESSYGRWRTYLPDESKPNKRRLIAKKRGKN